MGVNGISQQVAFLEHALHVNTLSTNQISIGYYTNTVAKKGCNELDWFTPSADFKNMMD